MRFILRILSFAALAGGIAAATLDAIRFVASGDWALSTLGGSLAWAGGGLSGPSFLNEAGRQALGRLLDQPAAPLFLALAFVLRLGFYRPSQPFRPFAPDDAI